MAYRKQGNKDGPTAGLISQTNSLTVIKSLFSIYHQDCVTHLTLMNRYFDIINYFNCSVINSPFHIRNKSSQGTGFQNSTHRAFILLRRWPVQMRAFSCMLMLPQVLHLLLMCNICRYLLLYITPTAPHITLHLLLVSSFLTSIFPAPPPPVHPSVCCHGRGASLLLPDAAIKALHLTEADTS